MCISWFILLASIVSLAKDKNKPTAEVTGAYQFFRTNGVNVPGGWDASVNIPANHWFGVVGDIWGATQSDSGVSTTVYAAGGGPQFTIRTPKVAPYFRFVFGAGHGSTSGSAFGFNVSSGTTAFVMSPGGGADFRITDQVWLRLGANYPIERKDGVTLDGFQTIVGITYKFGGRRETVDTIPTGGGNGATAAAAPILGVVVDSAMHVIRFFPNSVLYGHLEVGDVINSVDGKDVRTPDELTAATASLTKGTVVKLGYLVRG